MSCEELQHNESDTLTSIVNKYFSAFKDSDVDYIESLLSDDAIWHIDGDPSVSTVGLWYGKESIKTWLRNFPKNFKAREFVINKLICDDRNVIVTGRFRHTILSTNNTIGSDMAIHFTFNEKRKISRYQIFEDTDLLKKSFTPNIDFTDREIKINGIVYRYRDVGEGPVIIFSHGLFLDHSIYDNVVQTLSKKFRCLLIDMPAHGQSGYNKLGWSLDDIAADLAIFIDELSLGKVKFVGHSQGAMVGLRLAIKYPEILSNLVLLGASAREETSERKKYWNEVKAVLLHNDKNELLSFYEKISALFYQSKSETINQDELIKNKVEDLLRLNPLGLEMALDAAVFKRENIVDLLPLITTKTLIIQGENDASTSPIYGDEICKNIKNCSLVILPDTGHFLPLENPEEFEKHLLQFFAEE